LANYRDFNEIETALATATSGPRAAFTTLIALPNQTWELRTCHAIKIGNGVDAGRPGVFFLGGIHADEWGCPDILVNFIEQLQAAYIDPSHGGIKLGGKSFSHNEIRTIVDNLDIYVFPLANPDGRTYNRTPVGTPPTYPNAEWRKNRRPADPSSGCVGVDLNRNFDLLWNYKALMAPDSQLFVSDDPCSPNYQGPGPFSEPETLNVKWMHDTYSNIGYFVDLHSDGSKVLYSWSDDNDQSGEPDKHFRNALFDGLRGFPTQPSYNTVADKAAADAYLEYIPSDDLALAQHLADTMGAAIQAVRNVNPAYAVQQAVGLYSTTGTSDDYAYSRHIVDSSKRKVLAFTIECGDNPQPLPYDTKMVPIVQDVTSGLIAFCLAVRNSLLACSLTIARSSFGKDEVEAMLGTATPARFEAAFYVIIDGFRHEELGITAATLTGVPNVKPTVTFSPSLAGVIAQATACSAEGNTLVQGPQRFTWTFALEFTDSNDFTQEILPVTVEASVLAMTGVTLKAPALITLTSQPKPYEIDGSVAWLSVDLQVCQVLENGSLPSTPTLTLNAGPSDFIGRLLTAYNDPTLPRVPSHPFDLDLVANQASSTVEIAGSVGSTPVYNFALARVRYKALATPASNVRVFFRTFQAATTSTEYQPATTYMTGGIGGNRIPLPGVVGGEIVTIPFFAAPRVDPTNPDGLDAQTDPLNVGPLGNSIPPDGTGAEVQVYFGCWLDINQAVAVMPAASVPTTGPFVPVRSIQDIVKGKHQCLVAEIQLDAPAPQIPTAADPGSSDRLAQRNLTIVGVASPHLVPVTFDIRPTDAALRPGQTPDELMIEWGNLPAGARATIFLPGVKAATVVEMADRLYWHHELTMLDDRTLGCRAAGISYVPIPPGVESNHAGLLTVEVPAAVRTGQAFTVVARQVTRAIGIAPGRVRRVVAWRRIRGSFQVSIPVTTKASLLEPERRLLSVLRFMVASIPQSDRWHPVFHRYLGVVAGRVNALGGDADRVGPSTKGDWRAAARCRSAAAAAATILAAAVTSLGTLSGVATMAVPAVLALLLAVVASIWISRCRPEPARLSRSFIGGVGMAGTLLAVFALSGWTAPRVVPVLCGCVIVLAGTVLVGRLRSWF
jgi:murein tripeptide amidase MpaA